MKTSSLHYIRNTLLLVSIAHPRVPKYGLPNNQNSIDKTAAIKTCFLQRGHSARRLGETSLAASSKTRFKCLQKCVTPAGELLLLDIPDQTEAFLLKASSHVVEKMSCV